MKIFRLLAVSSISFLLMPIDASAHCGGKHTGDHPHCVSEPTPPPSGCTDTFPAFLYEVRGTKKTPAELRLASSDACRTESVVVEDFGVSKLHMTEDKSKGVILWAENAPGENPLQSKIVKRIDFTVNDSGLLTVEPAVTILPLANEEADPGDLLHYTYIDVWGDATHNLLYMVIYRYRTFNADPDAPTGVVEALIYDLNDLEGDLSGPAPDVRTIYRHEEIYPQDEDIWHWQPGGWLDAGDPSTLPDCKNVTYPEYVPTCYAAGKMTFNASGTRLYLGLGLGRDLIDSDNENWLSQARINTDDMADPNVPLSDWNLSGPELLWAGGPAGGRARPGVDPYVRPSPEIFVTGGESLDTDLCAGKYAPYTDGNNGEPLTNLWLEECTVGPLVGIPPASTWESSNSYLFDRLSQQGRGRSEIYRFHYSSEGLAGTEQLLMELARSPDTGM